MDYGEMGWGVMEWIGLVQDRDNCRVLVNAVMNLRGAMKCWDTVEWLHN
jgi:hypothetical protein